MKKLLLVIVLVSTMFAGDIVVKKSRYSVEKTMNKLQNIVTKKGFTVFAIVDHQKGADKVRMKLRPSKEIIFGNPKMGTVLMQEKMEVGLDLPIRVLIYQDKRKRTVIVYRNGTWLNSEHNLTQSTKLLKKMNYALDKMTTAAGR